ncbi:MAG: hypothetical protein P8Y94_17330, partial [Acidobacteriota bacterium]
MSSGGESPVPALPQTRIPPAKQLLAMLSEKVVDGFDAHLEGARRFVLIHIFEREVGTAGAFDDALYDLIGESIVTALQVGKLDPDEIRMTG